jgi:iron complex outermembrane receptor protein
MRSCDRTATADGKLWPALAASLLSWLPAGGHAQQGTGAQAGEKLEEIVVTAQKREQSAQDVPIAITAITADTLQANRVTNVADLSGLAPNVLVRPSAGSSGIPSFSMRGVVSYGVVPGSDKEVSIYLDGVYIGSPRASIFDLPDIERIEVLRGPQGTLFGRNSTAGAINIVTHNPDGQLGLHQELTFGDYNEFRTRTSLSLPTWGPFSAYASFVHDVREGDINNLGAGTFWDRSGPDTHIGAQTSPTTLGDKNDVSWFAAVKFEPNDSFRTIYKYDHDEDHFTPDGVAAVGINPNLPLIGPLLQTLVSSQPSPVVFDPSAKRPDSVNNAWATPASW